MADVPIYERLRCIALDYEVLSVDLRALADALRAAPATVGPHELLHNAARRAYATSARQGRGGEPFGCVLGCGRPVNLQGDMCAICAHGGEVGA